MSVGICPCCYDWSPASDLDEVEQRAVPPQDGDRAGSTLDTMVQPSASLGTSGDEAMQVRSGHLETLMEPTCANTTVSPKSFAKPAGADDILAARTLRLGPSRPVCCESASSDAGCLGGVSAASFVCKEVSRSSPRITTGLLLGSYSLTQAHPNFSNPDLLYYGICHNYIDTH